MGVCQEQIGRQGCQRGARVRGTGRVGMWIRAGTWTLPSAPVTIPARSAPLAERRSTLLLPRALGSCVVATRRCLHPPPAACGEGQPGAGHPQPVQRTGHISISASGLCSGATGDTCGAGMEECLIGGESKTGCPAGRRLEVTRVRTVVGSQSEHRSHRFKVLIGTYLKLQDIPLSISHS